MPGSLKRRSLGHHFDIHGYVAGNSAANSIWCPGIDLFKEGIPSTKLAGCDDTVLQWLWGVLTHLSHCFDWFGDGEAKLSESSYKRIFAYSPHYHPTLTALALPSLHVWVPCTLTGRLRDIFFTFTVIKACRKWWAKTHGFFNMSLNSTRARSEHSPPEKIEHVSHSKKTTLCNHLRK